jgi:hypothetical protein
MTSTLPAQAAGARADAAAAAAVRHHHAELAARLALHVENVVSTTPTRSLDGEALARFEESRRGLVAFCTGELLPHARAEEGTLYPAAARTAEATLLVRAMTAEHGRIAALVEEVTRAAVPLRAAASAYALRQLFESHLAKEDELLVPVLTADPRTRLADVLAGMHELLTGAERAPRQAVG